MAKPQENPEEIMHDQTHSQSPIKGVPVAETLKQRVSEQLEGRGDAELMHDQTHSSGGGGGGARASVAETLKRRVSEQLEGRGDAELMHDQTHSQS
jgi:hypothetical protein